MEQLIFSWRKGQQEKLYIEEDIKSGQLIMSMILFFRKKRIDKHPGRDARISRDNRLQIFMTCSEKTK